MSLFLTLVVATLAALMLIGWVADKRADAGDANVTPGLSLLPGDFNYDSEDGRVKVYIPIVTSIVLSIGLSRVLRLFG